MFLLLRELNREDKTGGHATVPPAAPAQIAALEQHWGRRLPPAYRTVLDHHDGGVKLWFDAHLLSTTEILEGRHGGGRLTDRFPELRKTVFARSTDSQDALAFDPSKVDEHGEMAVIQLGPDGTRLRWPSLDVLVRELMRRMFLGGANGATLYYVWTDLWLSWPHRSSVHSRGFVPKHGKVEHPDEVMLFVWPRDAVVQPFLSEPMLAHIDVYFAQAVETQAAQLAIVLTDAPVEDTARHYYVYYEPCATVVIALNPVEKQVTLYSDYMRWDALRARFMTIIQDAEQLLRDDRIAEAVLSSIDGACAALRSAQPSPG